MPWILLHQVAQEAPLSTWSGWIRRPYCSVEKPSGFRTRWCWERGPYQGICISCSACHQVCADWINASLFGWLKHERMYARLYMEYLYVGSDACSLLQQIFYDWRHRCASKMTDMYNRQTSNCLSSSRQCLARSSIVVSKQESWGSSPDAGTAPNLVINNFMDAIQL